MSVRCVNQGEGCLFLFADPARLNERVAPAFRSTEDLRRVQSQVRADGRCGCRPQQSLDFVPNAGDCFALGPVEEGFQNRIANRARRSLENRRRFQPSRFRRLDVQLANQKMMRVLLYDAQATRREIPRACAFHFEAIGLFKHRTHHSGS